MHFSGVSKEHRRITEFHTPTNALLYMIKSALVGV